MGPNRQRRAVELALTLVGTNGGTGPNSTVDPLHAAQVEILVNLRRRVTIRPEWHEK